MSSEPEAGGAGPPHWLNVANGSHMTSEGMALTGWTAGEEPAGLPSVTSSHLSGVTLNSLDGLTRPMEDQLVLVSKLIRRLQHLELPFLVGKMKRKLAAPQ